jgi:hypothetical protein
MYDSHTVLKYDLEYHEIVNLEFVDYAEFTENYTPIGSVYLNTAFGLFIVSGKNHDMLFFYNPINKSMSKLGYLQDNHAHGALIYYEKENILICLSGLHNRKVEYYTNDDLLINNTQTNVYLRRKNKWISLPEMNVERSEASYIIVNDTLYAFFGHCGPQNQNLSSVEKLDLSRPVQWRTVIYLNLDQIKLEIKSHTCVQLNGEEIIFLGGVFDNDKPVDKFSMFRVNDEKFIPSDRKFKDILYNNGYTFGKSSTWAWFKDYKDRLNYVNFDDMNHVHVIDVTNFAYDIVYFE